MGYSITFNAKSSKLKYKMLDFLKKNYQQPSFVIYLDDTDHLDYGDLKLGDKVSCYRGWEYVYVMCLIKWMALKIGARRSKFRDMSRLSVPVSYVSFDNEEAWPIITVTNVAEARKLGKHKGFATDMNGCYIGPSINDILPYHCDAIIDNKYFIELAALQKANNHKSYFEKLNKIKLKYCRPEINKMLSQVKADIQRLEDLWQLQ